MSFIVVVTSLENNSFEIVGTFENKDDAVTWTQAAFFRPEFEACLFRVLKMRTHDDTGPIRDTSEIPL